MKKSRFPTPSPSPRGDRRTIYVSDPSSIAIRYLPDPATEDSLRNWVDDLADAGTDTFIQEAYTQGWTTYWRTDKYEYDARPQHKRFVPLTKEVKNGGSVKVIAAVVVHPLESVTITL